MNTVESAITTTSTTTAKALPSPTRPSRNMTLEQALERAQELERERMELVAFINTIPEQELDNVERLTGMWVRPQMNQDSGYTLSKLAKIFKLVQFGRKDPQGMQERLDALSR